MKQHRVPLKAVEACALMVLRSGSFMMWFSVGLVVGMQPSTSRTRSQCGMCDDAWLKCVMHAAVFVRRVTCLTCVIRGRDQVEIWEFCELLSTTLQNSQEEERRRRLTEDFHDAQRDLTMQYAKESLPSATLCLVITFILSFPLHPYTRALSPSIFFNSKDLIIM